MPTNSGNDNRLLTLIYKMRSFFRLDKSGSIIGVKITPEDVSKAVYPNNYIIGDGIKKITMATAPPASPEVGDIWIDTS